MIIWINLYLLYSFTFVEYETTYKHHTKHKNQEKLL